MRLAEGRQVGNDTVKGLGTAVVPSKSGNHFVENEKRSVIFAESLQLMKEVVRRRLGSFCLQYDAGNLSRMFFEKRFNTDEIVVVKFDSQVAHRERNT